MRIIHRQQNIVATRRYKSFTYFFTQFGADRYILQVRISRTQTPSCRNSLIIRSMYSTRFLVYQTGQYIHIGIKQLTQRTVTEHTRYNRVFIFYFLQFLLRCSVLLCFCLFRIRHHFHGFKQYFAQLLWRSNIELHTCIGIYLGFYF